MNVIISCGKMSDELTNYQVSADIWTLQRDSIPSPWIEAVFLDQC